MTEPLQLTDIGITPRKAAQFASKGIETVQDLLMFFPTKYLDFRNPINLAEGKNYAGKHVAVKGQVVGTRVINPNARKHDALESLVGDIQKQKEVNTSIAQKRTEEKMNPHNSRLSKEDLLGGNKKPEKENAFTKKSAKSKK